MKKFIFALIILAFLTPEVKALGEPFCDPENPIYPCKCPEGIVVDNTVSSQTSIDDCTSIFCPDGAIAEKTIGCVKSPGGITKSDTKINDILNKISGYLVGAASAVSVIFIIIGGIKYATSLGDEEKMNKAKKTVMYALIGLVSVLLARYVVEFVIQFIRSS